MKLRSAFHGWIGQPLGGPLLCSLLASCWAGLPSTPEALARQRAEVVFDDPRAQALAVAAELNRTDEVRRLMREEGVDPDVFFGKQNDRLPLVAWPVPTLSPEGLKAMLENGADPNARSPDQRVTKYEDGSGRLLAGEIDPASRSEWNREVATHRERIEPAREQPEVTQVQQQLVQPMELAR